MVKFLSTPSGWRATAQFTLTSSTGVISIHALRVEGDHLLCGGHIIFGISIHALRVEGDFCLSFQIVFVIIFLSTPSGWRATSEHQGTVDFVKLFLSTPSGWRATQLQSPNNLIHDISIHALRVEGDLGTAMEKVNIKAISIHALRVEGDSRSSPITRSTRDFYPRPPGGGRRHSAE